MRTVFFTEDVRVTAHEMATARGYNSEVVEGCLAAFARDIGRNFDALRFRPPDHPERRLYQKTVKGLGLVEAVCEERGHDVWVVRLQVEAFD